MKLEYKASISKSMLQNGVDGIGFIFRRYMLSFKIRLDSSCNHIVKVLYDYTRFTDSKIFTRWMIDLYTKPVLI